MAKDPRDSRDYRGFEDRLSGDLSKASLQAQSLEDPKAKGSSSAGTQKLRVRGSDLPALIPAGSVIEFEQIPFHKLKFGDIIFVRFDKELCLRRFIRIKLKRDGASEMHVTQQGPNNMVQVLPCAALVGRVVSAESRGQTFNPRARESLATRMKDHFTDFGTTNLQDRLLGYWDFFKNMMKK